MMSRPDKIDMKLAFELGMGEVFSGHLSQILTYMRQDYLDTKIPLELSELLASARSVAEGLVRMRLQHDMKDANLTLPWERIDSFSSLAEPTIEDCPLKIRDWFYFASLELGRLYQKRCLHDLFNKFLLEKGWRSLLQAHAFHGFPIADNLYILDHKIHFTYEKLYPERAWVAPWANLHWLKRL